MTVFAINGELTVKRSHEVRNTLDVLLRVGETWNQGDSNYHWNPSLYNRSGIALDRVIRCLDCRNMGTRINQLQIKQHKVGVLQNHFQIGLSSVT